MINLTEIKDFNKEIYTIGISSITLKKFIDIINYYNITVIIDVRQNAYSNTKPEFNPDNLREKLKPYRIYHRNYTELGEKPKNKMYYDEENIVNFEWYTSSAAFKKGIEKIDNALKLNNKVCLLGYPNDPMFCHRSIMTGKYLDDNGYSVNNIITKNLENVKIETQKEVTNRLIEYYKNITKDKDKNEATEIAYKAMNKAIGHKYITLTVAERLPLFI